MKTVEECVAWVRECIGATPYDDAMVESTTAHLRRLSTLEAENKRMREALTASKAANRCALSLLGGLGVNVGARVAFIVNADNAARSALSGEG
jgi:hypothetical protein